MAAPELASGGQTASGRHRLHLCDWHWRIRGPCAAAGLHGALAARSRYWDGGENLQDTALPHSDQLAGRDRDRALAICVAARTRTPPSRFRRHAWTLFALKMDVKCGLTSCSASSA